MFVGTDRHAEVDRLVSLFGQVRDTTVPILVVYVAPTGWGKTRIIQEFYQRLAAGQPRPRYWPDSMEQTAPQNQTTLPDQFATGRKTVRPSTFTPPDGATPPWLWLALPSARLGDDSPAPALGHLTGQLAPHLPYLTARPRQHPQNPRDNDAALVGMLRGLLDAPDPAERPGAVIVLDDAHDLDAATVGFVSDVLGEDLPVLFLATTWPDRLDDDTSPFPKYLAEAATADRISRVSLGSLTTDDLVGYLLHQFPGTDPRVAAGLAERADRNPYALRLLLDTPRVRSASRHGRIALAPEEIDELRGGLDHLLGGHWARLPVGVRQILVAAALLGESFIETVLVEALGTVRPEGGLDAAIATAWIRPNGDPGGIVEFIERIRYEIARQAAPDVLSTAERQAVLTDALRAVRHLLHSSRDDSHAARHVLLALHIGLADAGAEPDLLAAAESAATLSEHARTQQRRRDAIRYLERAVAWAERSGDHATRQVIRYAVDLAAVTRVELNRARSEPVARRALDLAEAHLPPHDELRIMALLELARARRRREDWTAYQDSLTVLREAERLVTALPEPSPDLVRDLSSLRISFAGNEGRRSQARDRARELVAYCEQRYGPYHRHTLAVMDDFAYHALRADDLESAVEVRRQILARRVSHVHEAGYGQTAPARNNLAGTLVRLDGDAALDEAEQLATEAYTTWSRSYGVDGERTQRARLVLARVWQRRGLAMELAGDLARAEELFGRAAEETAAICELRARRTAGPRALALMRHGVSLACTRDDQAIATLTGALRLREINLRQDRTFWEVRECAEYLAWAYRRLGFERESRNIRRSYQLRGD
jgi:hypothetical protein